MSHKYLPKRLLQFFSFCKFKLCDTPSLSPLSRGGSSIVRPHTAGFSSNSQVRFTPNVSTEVPQANRCSICLTTLGESGSECVDIFDAGETDPTKVWFSEELYSLLIFISMAHRLKWLFILVSRLRGMKYLSAEENGIVRECNTILSIECALWID